MHTLDVSSRTWNQDCSDGSTDTKSHTHSNVTSGEKQTCSPACFLISPLSVCLAWHLMQALMLLPRLDKMVFFLLLFHRPPRGDRFCLLRPCVCDCKSMQHLVADASSLCSFSSPITRLPSGGSLTWDGKYKTCLTFDKSGSESSISGLKHRWNEPVPFFLIANYREWCPSFSFSVHQPRHSRPLWSPTVTWLTNEPRSPLKPLLDSWFRRAGKAKQTFVALEHQTISSAGTAREHFVVKFLIC